MHANFSPTLGGYSGQGAFRYWCQNVLPLTFDDSISYMELLAKVVTYLNNTISDVATAEENIDKLNTAFNQLQDYVNTYFDELDLEDTIDSVLDDWASDGRLQDVVEPFVRDEVSEEIASIVAEQLAAVVANQINAVVASQIGAVVAEQLPSVASADVTAWLNENVDPVGSAVVVDSSLTISGAAADAKVVGDKFTEVNGVIDDISESGNLINIASQSIDGVTIVNNNGILTINGTSTANINIPVGSYLGTYTFGLLYYGGTISDVSNVSLFGLSLINHPNLNFVTLTYANDTNVVFVINNNTTLNNFKCLAFAYEGENVPDYITNISANDKINRLKLNNTNYEVNELRKIIGEETHIIVDTDDFTNVDMGILYNGGLKQQATVSITPYIKCYPGTKLHYKLPSIKAGSTVFASMLFVTENKEFISSIYPETALPHVVEGNVIVPENAAYFIALNYPTYLLDPYVSIEGYGYESKKRKINVVFVGDSLTQGVTGGTSPNFDWADKPYPTILKEFLDEIDYNITIKNFGRRGLSAKTYWNDAIPVNSRYHSPEEGEPGDTIEFDNNIDVVIIMLGTNGSLVDNTIAEDTAITEGQTYLDYADTQCGDYCKIIEYIMENTDNHAQIILIAPVYACDSSYRNKIINTYPTIKALGERYQIPVINSTFESGIGWFNKGSFYNQTDLVHLNQAGYHKFGTFIASKFVSLYSTFDLSEIPE